MRLDDGSGRTTAVQVLRGSPRLRPTSSSGDLPVMALGDGGAGALSPARGGGSRVGGASGVGVGVGVNVFGSSMSPERGIGGASGHGQGAGASSSMRSRSSERTPAASTPAAGSASAQSNASGASTGVAGRGAKRTSLGAWMGLGLGTVLGGAGSGTGAAAGAQPALSVRRGASASSLSIDSGTPMVLSTMAADGTTTSTGIGITGSSTAAHASGVTSADVSLAGGRATTGIAIPQAAHHRRAGTAATASTNPLDASGITLGPGSYLDTQYYASSWSSQPSEGGGSIGGYAVQLLAAAGLGPAGSGDAGEEGASSTGTGTGTGGPVNSS